MARLDLENTKRSDKSRNTIHGKVVATYTSFEQHGLKFLQIDTYGSPEREFTEKVSQSFQIDKDMAVFLCKLLQQEFDL